MESTDKTSDFAPVAVDTIAYAAEAMDEKKQQLDNAEQQMMNDVRDYIHQNPITSASIGIAAGFFLSRLLSSH